MALDTIGSIATHVIEVFNNISAGISGNMIEIVDMARQDVQNFVGNSIGSNSIAAEYQPAIVNFSKAETIDLVNAQAGGGADLRLAELTVSDKGEQMSADQLRKLAQGQLKNLGRRVRFARSVS